MFGQSGWTKDDHALGGGDNWGKGLVPLRSLTCGKWQLIEMTGALGLWAWVVEVNDKDEKWVWLEKALGPSSVGGGDVKGNSISVPRRGNLQPLSVDGLRD